MIQQHRKYTYRTYRTNVWERVRQEQRVGLLNYYAWHTIGKIDLPEYFIYLLTLHITWSEVRVEVISNVKSNLHSNGTTDPTAHKLTHFITVNCLFTKQYLLDNRICQIQNWIYSFEMSSCDMGLTKMHILYAFIDHSTFCFLSIRQKLAFVIDGA